MTRLAMFRLRNWSTHCLIQSKRKRRTLGNTLGKVKTEALVLTLSDTLEKKKGEILSYSRFGDDELTS